MTQCGSNEIAYATVRYKEMKTSSPAHDINDIIEVMIDQDALPREGKTSALVSSSSYNSGLTR